ncbi:TBC-domain-containing protein [Meira miltonrushii]|uniref:TBC-domain-containing protein n=1 Tax=Meira miltonrushii TaxID=1280837 RepID=A0A316V7W2_9BASI|nr:TBC-domain-containing protein [Meira miltonrushii]PWN33709.1 TBC-domain-containing protein [Meira miltonrushii]
MDAHTLNAWTRFALQKGGIGSCTALIDNPATDLEDLMFMAGEKIVVLRRLDDEAQSESSKGRGVISDADAWFLGYCEGVVGRFKGAHVQFHGKLKKPVLMRRSGVGAIRESTLRPMSKSEAANLHASQVPPGIPVTAVDSDEEDGSIETSGSRKSTQVNPDTTRDQKYNGKTVGPSSTSIDRHRAEESLSSNKGLNGKMARLGVTTPPLSDESHARAAIARKASIADDSDSDDESDTHLPWARASTASNFSSASHDTPTKGNGSDPHQQSLAQGTLSSKAIANLNMSNTLPPSPISSAESPLTSKSAEHGIPPSGSFEGVIPRIRAPGSGHKQNSDSVSTMTTSESEEDARRKDHALSIYEIYGRDSVAFPNFDFRSLNGKTSSLGGRLTPAKSAESLSVPRSTPASPLLPVDSSELGQRQPAIALRASSNRRPTAAPPVPTGQVASSLRRKAEAGSAASSSDHSLGMTASGSGSGSFGTFDPRRRPSMGNLNSARHQAGRGPMSPQDARMPGMSGDGSNFVPPMPAAMEDSNHFRRPSSDRVLGSNLLARRAQESGPMNDGPSMLIDTQNVSRPNNQRNDSFMRVTEGALPSPSAANFRRTSSDRTSHRERVGSGQLRKNPSNPQPGPHGGMTALMIPPSNSNHQGQNNTPSRSPSPLSAQSVNGTGMRPYSPSGALSASPSNNSQNPALGSSPSRLPSPLSPNSQAQLPLGRQPQFGGPQEGVNSPTKMFSGANAPFANINPANVSFDKLGFLIGTSPPFTTPMEDAEDMKVWRQLVAENNVESAKKGRKVKKMVHNGIPHSMRATVWPFLASAHVRRRPGLFEELCKVSQSAKGKRGKEALYEAIDKDLDRAYPDHKQFMGPESTGVADLEAILKAYVHYNPIVGYTQGMNLVAGFLLIQMPAEEAFWLMCALLRDVHMEGYYSGEMKQLHVDGIIFGQLLQAMDPELAARLIELNVEPINFAPNWLLPLFSRILPWQTLLRAWDVFFFEGPSWILRVALAVVRILRDPLMDKRVCPGTGEALRLLLHPPQQLLTPENVIPCALSVKLKDGEMRKLGRQASKLVRSTVLNQATRGRSQSVSASSVSRSSSAPPVKRQHAGQ